MTGYVRDSAQLSAEQVLGYCKGLVELSFS